jgi:hypothetical protein
VAPRIIRNTDRSCAVSRRTDLDYPLATRQERTHPGHLMAEISHSADSAADAATDKFLKEAAAEAGVPLAKYLKDAGITFHPEAVSRDVMLSRLGDRVRAANPIFNVRRVRAKARKDQLGSRASANGDVKAVGKARKSLPVERRFWPRVEQPTTGCWTWHGPVDRDGAGVFEGRRVYLAAGGSHPCPESGLCARPDHVR